MALAEERRPGIRPRQSLGRRLDAAARHAFPASCTILLMLLSQTPFGILDQAVLLPAVTLAAVWFWSLFRPAAMPPPVVFIIGILLDLMGWQPIGSGVLTLLVVHGLAVRWRRILAPLGFVAIWLAFALIAAGAAGLQWVLTAVLTWRLVPAAPAAFQAVLSVAAYPALAILFAGAHRSVADPEQA